MTDGIIDAASPFSAEVPSPFCEEELLQMEALLIARAYLYELFWRLIGGTPDEELLDAALSVTTQDVLEEFSGASNELKAFTAFLFNLRKSDRLRLLDAAKDEYTRIFVGPAALPAAPYESPYRGNHDMSLFQENTLAVRSAYKAAGFAPRRMQSVPDDHAAMMLSFMATVAERARVTFFEGASASLAEALEMQYAFLQEHMGDWLDMYTEGVRNSKAGHAAVFYPQLLEAVAAFAKADRNFLIEAAYWASGRSDFAPRECSSELAEAESQLLRLRDMMPLGVTDFEMIEVQD